MNEQQTPIPSSAVTVQSQQRFTRWLWLGLGFVLVLIGGLGVILPVLPATVFFIGAAACFTRSSPRFEQWVLDLPRIGPLVRDYRSGLGMPKRAKLIATITIAIAILLSSIFIPSWLARLAAYAFALLGIGYILLRVPTRERVVAQREALIQAANDQPNV